VESRRVAGRATSRPTHLPVSESPGSPDGAKVLCLAVPATFGELVEHHEAAWTIDGVLPKRRRYGKTPIRRARRFADGKIGWDAKSVTPRTFRILPETCSSGPIGPLAMPAARRHDRIEGVFAKESRSPGRSEGARRRARSGSLRAPGGPPLREVPERRPTRPAADDARRASSIVPPICQRTAFESLESLRSYRGLVQDSWPMSGRALASGLCPRILRFTHGAVLSRKPYLRSTSCGAAGGLQTEQKLWILQHFLIAQCSVSLVGIDGTTQ